MGWGGGGAGGGGGGGVAVVETRWQSDISISIK